MSTRKREATRTPGVRKVTTATADRVTVTYEARLRGPDGRNHSKTFHRLDDAKAFRTAVLAGRDRGEWKDPRVDRLTFQQWTAAPEWERHQTTLRPKTKEIYKRAIDRAVNSLGSIPLSRITREHVENFRDELLKTLNPGGTNQTIRVLRTCLAHAEKVQLIVRNPASKVRAEDDVRPEDRPERRALSQDEAARLLVATPEKWRALVATSLTLGLRWSELAGLQRKHVDLEAGEIRVERQA